MKKLIKIKSIDNFRFFEKFRWDVTIDCFDKFNIIYGWNGSGKSTLCDMLFNIEKEKDFEDNQKFQMLFQQEDQASVTMNKTSISLERHRLKVFHQNYVDDLIQQDKVAHIYIIGADEGEAVNEIKELKKDKEIIIEALDKYKELKKEKEESFTSLKRNLAKIIRSSTGYDQGYNVNKVYERYKEITKLIVLDKEELKKITRSVLTEQKKTIPINEKNFVKGNVKEYIQNILKEKPIHRSVERFRKDANLREWAQTGYDIHIQKKTKVCEFCQNIISDEQWIELEEYFNDSLNAFKVKIREAKIKLESYRSNIEKYKNSIPIEDQLYEELGEIFLKRKIEAELLCDKYDQFLAKTISILKRKESLEEEQVLLEELNRVAKNLDFDYSILDNLDKLVKEHNKKSEDFSKSVSDDKKRLENHYIACEAKKIQNFEKSIRKYQEKQKEAEDKLIRMNSEIIELENKVRNSRIPAEKINEDISFILGRSNISFEWKETGYEIKRDDKVATGLSKGEKNALALIYFFNSLKGSDTTPLNESIVILDDPISSFDSNFYYSAIAYIRDKLENVGQAFILTHKFSLYKDMTKMFGNSRRYLLERENGQPVLKKESQFLKDFEDEYTYLFKKVYDFVSHPPSDLREYIPYPNIARRLLEGFLSFKIPEKYQGKDILKRALEMENGECTERVRAIARLLNNQSHLRKVCPNVTVENILDTSQLPGTLKHLLEFIEKHDERHYKSLEKQVQQTL